MTVPCNESSALLRKGGCIRRLLECAIGRPEAGRATAACLVQLQPDGGGVLSLAFRIFRKPEGDTLYVAAGNPRSGASFELTIDAKQVAGLQNLGEPRPHAATHAARALRLARDMRLLGHAVAADV